MATVGEFLNPKSMLTPGAAGGIVMIAANTFWAKFGIAQELTGLIVSLLLSFLIISRIVAPFLERGAYFLLNALIIFCVAGGATGVGHVTVSRIASNDSAPRSAVAESSPSVPGHFPGIIGVARAQTDEEMSELCGDPAELDDKTKRLCEILRMQREQPEPQPQPSSQTEQQKRTFFQPWFKGK